MFPLLVHSPLLASTFRLCEFDHITSSYSCDSNSYDVSNADYTLLDYWHLCIFPSYPTGYFFYIQLLFWVIFLIKNILCVLPACMYLHRVHSWASGGQQWVRLIPRNWGYRCLWVTMWVRWTEPRCFSRTTISLNCWALSWDHESLILMWLKLTG